MHRHSVLRQPDTKECRRNVLKVISIKEEQPCTVNFLSPEFTFCISGIKPTLLARATEYNNSLSFH